MDWELAIDAAVRLGVPTLAGALIGALLENRRDKSLKNLEAQSEWRSIQWDLVRDCYSSMWQLSIIATDIQELRVQKILYEDNANMLNEINLRIKTLADNSVDIVAALEVQTALIQSERYRGNADIIRESGIALLEASRGMGTGDYSTLKKTFKEDYKKFRIDTLNEGVKLFGAQHEATKTGMRRLLRV